nr:cytosolic non-specific dipeptidase-like [Dermacentor andersoni]
MGSTHISKDLQSIFRIIDENKAAMVGSLKELVSISSVSAQTKHRADVKRCIEWTKKALENEGLRVDLVPLIGDQNVCYGNSRSTPPVLLGSTEYNNRKNTVMAYGYLDVHPAKKSDGWDTEPFVPEDRDGKVYGRGCAAGKGPMVAWIWALKAFNIAGVALPVNLRFVIDSTKEVGSQEVMDYIQSKMSSDFYCRTSSVVLSDGCWLESSKPCISFGLRGMCYFQVDVTCASQDLHSGVYGGTILEGMSDLVSLLNSLTDDDGCVSVPGFCDELASVTEDENRILEHALFDLDTYRENLGVPQLTEKDKVEALKRIWYCPSLSIHGIQGAYSGSGEKAVIPGHVIGKFSVRTVPYQRSEKVCELITKHLESEFAKRNSPNRLKVTMTTSCEPWTTYPRTANFRAAQAAVKQVYGTVPGLIRSGASVAAASTLYGRASLNTIQVPISAASGYCVNENIPVDDLVRGAKLFAAYCYEVARFP